MKKDKYIGKTLNRLTVLSVHDVIITTAESGRINRTKRYLCSCSCGKETIVSQSSLGTGKAKSCGCARTDSNISRVIDITGQVFSKLTAISFVGNGSWLCKCSCGTETIVKSSRLKNGNTKSCGCTQRELAKEMMLDKHRSRRESLGLPQDRPIASEKKLERMRFRELSPAILKRDNYTCCLCSQIGRELHVHHIIPWSIDESLRFCKENLVTLCAGCHRTVHNNNFHSDPNAELSILIQGYVLFIQENPDYFEEKAWAARISVTQT